MPGKSTKKPPLKTIKFELEAPEAKEVYLAGDFNEWNPSRTPLKADKKKGNWKGSVKLQPGRYNYKFVVDGHWWTDPKCDKTEWNEYGTQNSIIEIK